MIAPDTAKPAPASTQAKVRGSLEYQKILPATPLSAPSVTACHTSVKDSFALPKHKLSRIAATHKTANAGTIMFVFFLLLPEQFKEFFICLSPFVVWL